MAAHKPPVAKPNDFVAIGHSAGPWLTVLARYGETFVQSTVVDPPTGNVWSVEFSPNGEYMVVCLAASPYVAVYRRSGLTFTKLPNPTTLPTSTARRATFSSNSLRFVLFGANPSIKTYSISGNGPAVDLGIPNDSPAQVAFGGAFNANNSLMAAAVSGNNQVRHYTWNGATYTYGGILSGLTAPYQVVFGPYISTTYDHVIVANGASPGASFYIRNGTSWTPSGSFSHTMPNGATSVDRTADGVYYAFGSNGPTSVYVFKHDLVGNFTKLANLPNDVGVQAFDVRFSKQGTHLAVCWRSGGTGLGGVRLYRRTGDNFTNLGWISSGDNHNSVSFSHPIP